MSKEAYGLEKYDHIKNLIKAAEKVPAAKYKLALLYLEGKEIGKDEKEAVSLLEEASKSHQDAAYVLGGMYLEGEVVEKDITEGIKLIERAADKGSEKGLYRMGLMCKEGEYVDQDIEKAEEYFSQVPKSSELYARALYELGKIYLYEKDQFIEAQTYLVSAYKKGSVEGAYLLGKVYFEGKYTKVDYKVSYKYVDYAASKGQIDAIAHKSEFYIKGIGGVEQSEEKGIKLLESASEGGSVGAKYKLVELNLEEKGHRSDKGKAKSILKELANDGHGKAGYMLSKIYFEEGHKKEGDKWLRKAANLNEKEAQLYLGKKILKECELKKNEGILDYFSKLFTGEGNESCSKGLEWIGQANVEESDLILGKAYIEGKYGNKKVVEIKEEKGIEYLRKAISNGILEANYLLGKNILEREQEITEKEKREAVGEIAYAAREGNVEAKCYLGELKVEGKYVEQNKEKGRELNKEAAEAGYYKAIFL